MNSKCEECMHFDGYACYSEDVCFANNRFKPKERNYVNMFVDDMKIEEKKIDVCIGEKIKEYRKKRGITQYELAELIGKSKSSIEKYEADNVVPSIEAIMEISEALNVDFTEMIQPTIKLGNINSSETVDHPSHYNKGIEAIEYIESHDFNFNLGNAIKYITRCEHKGNKVEDLKKSLWYLERELAKEK